MIIPRKIANPLSVRGTKEPIASVLFVIAGQNGCDGHPYDQMQEAGLYIEELEAEIIRLRGSHD